MATYTIIADPSPRAIAQRLRTLGREFRTWRPAWRASAPLVARGIRENLLGQGGPIGESWEPLKPDTLKRKNRLGRNRGPLIASGSSILNPLTTINVTGGGAPQGRDTRGRFTGGGKTSAPDGMGSAAVVLSATRMKVGLAGAVPNIQHFGSKRRGIPARRYMDWSTPMERAVLAAMNAYARQLIAQASAAINSDRRGLR